MGFVPSFLGRDQIWRNCLFRRATFHQLVRSRGCCRIGSRLSPQAMLCRSLHQKRIEILAFSADGGTLPQYEGRRVSSLATIREMMRLPGIEPGLQAWEAHVLTPGPQPLSPLREGLAHKVYALGWRAAISSKAESTVFSSSRVRR